MRFRSWLLPALLLVVVFLFLVQRLSAPARSSAAPSVPLARVALSEDQRTVHGLLADGSVVLEFTIEEWRVWADENLVERLGQPVRIGEQEMTPDRFEMFGAASLSPGGDLVVLTATTYAILTTVSITGVLEVGRDSFDVVAEPAFGNVEEVAWSADQRFIAYTLGTARAAGDHLRVDDMGALHPTVTLSGEDVLEAASSQGRATVPDDRPWMPGFRDLKWTEDQRLEFSTNDPGRADEGGELRWRVTPSDGGLVTAAANT